MFLKRNRQNSASFTKPEAVRGVGYEARNERQDKWDDHTVLYDGEVDNFSVAIGTIDGIQKCAIRWNGDRHSDAQQGGMEIVGTPSPGGGPFWFILPDFLAETVVQRVIERNHSPELRLLFPSSTDKE